MVQPKYFSGAKHIVPRGAYVRTTRRNRRYRVRWQPLDPKYIGALTLRGSYTEAFHAPTLLELSPAGQQAFPLVVDPFSNFTLSQVEERINGNPFLHPETAYEWTYGIGLQPKWIKGLTVSADWWHIDMRSIVATLGSQFLINNSLNPAFAGNVIRTPPPPGAPPAPYGGPDLGPVSLVLDPNENLSGAIFEGLDYEAIYILDSSIFGQRRLWKTNHHGQRHLVVTR